MFPHSLSPRSIAQLPSVHWPEVMATHVDPIPLSDTPPPLPAKKHRRQQQVKADKLGFFCYCYGGREVDLHGKFLK